MIALAYRRYLGGRDLFDLWFHWLRSEEGPSERWQTVLDLARKKLHERKLKENEFRGLLSSRLQEGASLKRAQEEWKRYLPADFQKTSVLGEIVSRCRRLPEIFS